MLVTVPLANISGIYSTIVAAATGRSIIVEEKFTLAGLLDYIRTWRPGNIGGPPALVKMILDADVPREDLASAKFVTMGMGPVDPEIRRQFEAKYNIPILPCYGATEFVGAATALSMDDYKRYGEAKFGSVGRPVAGGSVRIRDQETGEFLAPGDERIGLVEVHLPHVGSEWIKTTDLGFLDADGFLYLRGRADGVIIRGGFKIHPSAIETALLQHPAVAACAVVGLPHERLGAVPVAAVEPKPDCPAPTAAELETWLRQRLPATNIPAHYRVVAELPRTPSLKVRLDAVKELFRVA
jgi:acyl-CoA synthetase (AMP-forming)/AMP-acid ligase II